MRTPPIKVACAGMNVDHAAICRTVAAIPCGKVASYGEVAARAGLPRRARLVGLVLRQAPQGLKLPWHRVVRSDGRIAFAPGSTEFRAQLRKLAAEGVPSRNGRIDLAVHGWDRDVDGMLWGPPTDARPSAPRRSERVLSPALCSHAQRAKVPKAKGGAL